MVYFEVRVVGHVHIAAVLLNGLLFLLLKLLLTVADLFNHFGAFTNAVNHCDENAHQQDEACNTDTDYQANVKRT